MSDLVHAGAGHQVRGLREQFGNRAVPRVPFLSAKSIGRSICDIPTLLDIASYKLTPSGRISILLALSSCLSEGDEVLLPAFHSPAIVASIIHLGGSPVFYRLNDDLTADMKYLEGRVSKKTRALISIHYFGFLQDLRPLRQFCDECELTLIEDCAHAFFGEADGRVVGSVGDFAIGSLTKFFPVFDGGCVVSNRRSLVGVPRKQVGLARNARAFVNLLEYAVAYERNDPLTLALRPILGVSRIRGYLQRSKQSATVNDAVVARIDAADDDEFVDAALIPLSCSLTTKGIIAATSFERNVSRRRRNYARMLAALQSLPGCKPLFADLPDKTVPWLFPVIFDDVAAAYDRLDKAGMPIPHFGKTLSGRLDPSVCSRSTFLSRNCLQLPCHQDLTDSEVDWIIAQICGAVGAKSPH